MSQIQTSFPQISPRALAAAAGALGGLLSFPVGEIVGDFTDMGEAQTTNLLPLLFHSGLWAGAIGLVIGAAILIYDNAASLRGQWHRDLGRAIPVFWLLSFLGGATGQMAYTLVQNSLTRGVGWALMGAGVGLGIGVLRRDWRQAARGALGGFIGGFLGGFVFDALTLISSAGGGALSRLVGQILVGALIALLMRVVQDALKSAWLLGISAGPYEGKEYGLNTSRVTVGRAGTNDIALFREEIGPPQLGALVFENGKWWWRGESVSINDAPQTHAPLGDGDALQLGTYRFRFKTRSTKTRVENVDPIPAAPDVAAPISVPVASSTKPVAPQTASTNPVLTKPISGAPKPPVVAPIPSVNAVVTSSNPPVVAPVATPILTFDYVLLTPSGEQFPVPLVAPFEVGRGAHNALVLPDESVSGTHARFQLVAGALTVCDLGSTNGTFVNASRLMPQTPTTLRNGDRVRLGKSELVVLRLNG